MPRPLTLLLLLLLPVYPAIYLYGRLAHFGAFRSNFSSAIKEYAQQDRFVLEEMVQVEDLAYHEPSGMIIALGQTEGSQRWSWFPPWANFDDPQKGLASRGALWAIDPKTWKHDEIQIEGFDQSFATHGIDIFPSDSPDKFYLHAVNHAPLMLDGQPQAQADSRIEVFSVDLSSSTALHRKTIKHPLVTMPNDIYSLGPLEMLVTNDHHFRHGILRLLEDLINLKLASWTKIIHLDASGDKVQGKVVADRLHNANGLGHGPNGTVTMGDASGGDLVSFHWTESALVNKTPIDVQVNLDNPVWYSDPYATPKSDASGYVLGGLLTGLELDKQARDPKLKIPTSVYIARVGKNGLEKHLLLEDDGNFVSGASVGMIVPIPPKKDGKKEGWLVTSGPWGSGVSVIKVDLTSWASKGGR